MDTGTSQEEMLRLLRSRTLDIWADAALLREYIRLCAITQSECAVRLGRSQSSVANRLRLLRLSPEIRAAMRSAQLGERHARALLRLPEETRSTALRTVCAGKLSVADTESLVDALLRSPDNGALSTLLCEIRSLRDRGICESAEENVEADGLRITLFFPNSRRFS